MNEKFKKKYLKYKKKYLMTKNLYGGSEPSERKKFNVWFKLKIPSFVNVAGILQKEETFLIGSEGLPLKLEISDEKESSSCSCTPPKETSKYKKFVNKLLTSLEDAEVKNIKDLIGVDNNPISGGKLIEVTKDNKLYLEEILFGEMFVNEADVEELEDEAVLMMTFVTNNNNNTIKSSPNTSIMKAINEYVEGQSDYARETNLAIRTYYLPAGNTFETWKEKFIDYEGEVTEVVDINKYKVEITKSTIHRPPENLSAQNISFSNQLHDFTKKLFTFEKVNEGIYSVIYNGKKLIFFVIKDKIENIAWEFLNLEEREATLTQLLNTYNNFLNGINTSFDTSLMITSIPNGLNELNRLNLQGALKDGNPGGIVELIKEAITKNKKEKNKLCECK